MPLSIALPKLVPQLSRGRLNGVKVAAAFLGLLATGAGGADAAWTVHGGRFATFELPLGMRKNLDVSGIDSFIDPYVSADFDINFDSTVETLPPGMQAQLDRTVSAWAEQRKTDWTKRLFVDGGGAVLGSSIPSTLNPPTMPCYLYLGFVAGKQGNFAIQIYFRRVEQLNDVERILRSIKLKSS